MKIANITSLAALLVSIFLTSNLSAQTIYETDINRFKVSGYIRTGLGYNEDGSKQVSFQMPGALNKYSLGNQADTYGELAFDYTRYLNSDKTTSLDAVWMVSSFEPFTTNHRMAFNLSEQFYLRANNLFGGGESVWFGKRYYDRKSIYMLDRQWINPGQGGWGAGVESLLSGSGEEDLKIAAWQLKDKDVTSYKSGLRGELTTYTADIRWVNKQIAQNTTLNLALNYSRRLANEELGYEAYNGYGAFAWVDYTQSNISNTTAIIVRQGATISKNHWCGMSQKENPNNDKLVLNDIGKAHTFEVNNNFLYDDKERFAINAVFIFAACNYGTDPYHYEAGERSYLLDRGETFYWVTGATRAMYYISARFRPTLEYSYEYGNNAQLGVAGSMHRVTLTPEFSLTKGYYSRPVVRPYISYTEWSSELKGSIGGAPFANQTSGFTYGVQFEIWW